MGRTGSEANICAGSLVIGCTGFFVIAGDRFFVIARTGLLVITCTMSFAPFLSWLAKSNAEGASACACTVTLEMTRIDVVVEAKQTSPRTKASYAGNPDPWQAFFPKPFFWSTLMRAGWDVLCQKLLADGKRQHQFVSMCPKLLVRTLRCPHIVLILFLPGLTLWSATLAPKNPPIRPPDADAAVLIWDIDLKLDRSLPRNFRTTDD